MRRFHGFLVLALLAAGSLARPAATAWGLTPPEHHCQQAIERAAARLLKRSIALLASCNQAVARGALAAGTDCLADAATSLKRTQAADKATKRIQRICSDGEVASIAPAGDCFGASTVNDLIACLRASHEADAEVLAAVASVVPTQLSSAARACKKQASRQARRFALQRLRLIQRCKRHPPLDRLLPGMDCSAEPVTAGKIAALRAQANAHIISACGGGVLDETPFGAPCEASATAAELAECLLATAEAVTDEAIAAEHPDNGFCGDSREAVEQRIDDLIAQMTLAEKVDQMHGSGLAGLTWGTPQNASLGIPGFNMVDGPRGVAAYAGNATAFPVGMARGATWDPALEKRVGAAIGMEARAKGASVLLAPTVNILRHPRWGRAQETYGEDAFHLGQMGVGFIQGAQQYVIASAKHFDANSIEDTRFVVDVTVDERSLREVYTPHFRMAVQQGHVGSIMSAYNQLNGHYCAENPHLLTDILKGDWAFQGFVESDWVFGTRSTVPSANAGLDIEMPVPHYFGQALIDAVTAASVSEEVIDAAVRRVLRAKLCFRLDTDPPVPDPSLIESAEHLDLALEVARKSIVLLKNDGMAVPLDRSQTDSIVVVGSLASQANIGDNGSSNVAPSFVVTPLQGIQAGTGNATVTYVPGPALSGSDQAAIASADAAVVVAGLTKDDEGEGLVGAGDRETMGLSAEDDQLISDVAALNARTIVVLEGGSAITMPWVDDVAAILMAWYPGMEGGNAIADVLFGDVNPSGKLPITFPVAEADLPTFDNVSSAVTYGYDHGYRWLDQQGFDPLFPFGFGLSYTTFQYSNLVISPATLRPAGRLRVTADVTNTGSVAGDEIAELYISYQGSQVSRDVKDLKAFARIHLEAGETRTVPFEVRARDLAFYDVANETWVTEPIIYGVHVGPSSRDLPLEGSFTITAN